MLKIFMVHITVDSQLFKIEFSFRHHERRRGYRFRRILRTIFNKIPVHPYARDSHRFLHLKIDQISVFSSLALLDFAVSRDFIPIPNAIQLIFNYKIFIPHRKYSRCKYKTMDTV